jgi:hypothetical protein
VTHNYLAPEISVTNIRRVIFVKTSLQDSKYIIKFFLESLSYNLLYALLTMSVVQIFNWKVTSLVLSANISDFHKIFCWTEHNIHGTCRSHDTQMTANMKNISSTTLKGSRVNVMSVNS